MKERYNSPTRLAIGDGNLGDTVVLGPSVDTTTFRFNGEGIGTFVVATAV